MHIVRFTNISKLVWGRPSEWVSEWKSLLIRVGGNLLIKHYLLLTTGGHHQAPYCLFTLLGIGWLSNNHVPFCRQRRAWVGARLELHQVNPHWSWKEGSFRLSGQGSQFCHLPHCLKRHKHTHTQPVDFIGQIGQEHRKHCQITHAKLWATITHTLSRPITSKPDPTSVEHLGQRFLNLKIEGAKCVAMSGALAQSIPRVTL